MITGPQAAYGAVICTCVGFVVGALWAARLTRETMTREYMRVLRHGERELVRVDVTLPPAAVADAPPRAYTPKTFEQAVGARVVRHWVRGAGDVP